MIIKRTRLSWLIFIMSMLHTDSNAQGFVQPEAMAATLLASFKNKNAQTFLPYLSEKFSVGVYTRPAADHMMQNIMERYPLDTLLLQRIDSMNGKKRIVFTATGRGKSFTTHAYLNNKNEVLYIDLFDQLYGVDKYKPSVLKAVIPFQLVGGAIVVTAKLNQSSRPLQLLFDTGADGMALNKSLADSLGLTISREQKTSVVGGQMQVSISSGNELHLDTLSIPGNNIALFEEIGKGYDGILGCTIATRYITKVNFDKQVIELYSFGAYVFEKEGSTVAVEFPSGVPMIPLSAKVGEKEVKGKFVFDTGANYYLIAFGPFVKQHLLLTNGFVPYFTGATVSMGHATTTFTGNFEKMIIGEMEQQNFPGVLQAYKPGDEKFTFASGSLGIKTMRRFNFTIDLSRQAIHFTPNKNYGLPVDFIIGNLVLSFNSKKQLLLSQLVNENITGSFREGDIISSINGIKVEQLIREPKKIKVLQASAKKFYTVEIVRNGITQNLMM